MKYVLFILIILGYSSVSFSQEQFIPPTNGTATSLEKNLFFHAASRFRVTQSGSITMHLPTLFDGSMLATYSSTGIDVNNPYVLLIEDLPDYHTQRGAWFGWSTRYYQATRFKVEAFDQWSNSWVVVDEVHENGNFYYTVRLPHMSVGKIRLTIYETYEPNNLLGLSEVFFIHPEATKAYDGLMVQYTQAGNVNIGSHSRPAKLAVNGDIRTREVKVETANWPDYVFKDDYDLKSLQEINQFINAHGHLPDIPKAAEVEQNGVSLGEMNKLLLKKIEELTLHLIEKDKQIQNHECQMLDFKKELDELQRKLNSI